MSLGQGIDELCGQGSQETQGLSHPLEYRGRKIRTKRTQGERLFITLYEHAPIKYTKFIKYC